MNTHQTHIRLVPDLYDSRDIAIDAEELRTDFLHDHHFNNIFTVNTISHDEARQIMPPVGEDASIISLYEYYADEDMIDLVAFKMKNFDHKRIVLMLDNKLLDGYHHIVAAIYSKQPVRFIDLAEFS